VVGLRRFKLQKLRQATGPGVMHRGTDHGLDTLQVQLAGCPAVAENDVKQLLYFTGDFFLDRFGFFLRGRRSLSHWPQFADPRVDLNELLTEPLIDSY
jgi:hypothetical protein